MKLTLDFSQIYDNIITLACSIDYYAVFCVTLIFSASVAVARLALKLLAEKQIKFSLGKVFIYLTVSAACFYLAFLEHENQASVFRTLDETIIYGSGLFVALTVLYAVFFASAHKNAKVLRAKSEHAPTYSYPYVARVSESKEPDSFAVYPLVGVKLSEKKKSTKNLVDFNGVYGFLRTAEGGGADEKRVRKLRDMISFYDGTDINKGNIRTINELFAEAIIIASKQ